MQTNQYGQTYVGNDDYRGWLQSLAQQGSKTAGGLLQYAGNDGNVSDREATGSWLDDDANLGRGGGWGLSYHDAGAANDAYYKAWNDQRQAANPTADGSGSSSAEDAATNARMRGIYDQQIGDINKNLSSQDAILKNNLDSVKGEYDTYKNEQQSNYNQAENNYNQSTLQNKQNLQANRNSITNNASSAMRGLLRMLGAMGAGGSSVARYNVPEMVRNQANDEYNNAGKTFAQNQQNLDTNWGNYKINAENDRKKLEDWYNGQVKSKQQESEERKQSLLNELVTAYGNRAQYGGDYGNNVSDAFNRIAQSRDAVTNLGQYTTPNYTGTTAVYNAPSLDNYNANTASVATGTTDSNTSASSPLLTALQSLTKRKENNQ